MKPKPFTQLTPHEQAILRCIDKAVRKNGCPPSIREVTVRAGVPSLSTTRSLLIDLAAQGWIDYAPGASRTWTLLRALPVFTLTAPMISIPLVVMSDLTRAIERAESLLRKPS